MAFLSGFTGSSGVAIVGAYDAHLWTDSRYYIQAERELSRAWTLHKDGLPGVPTWTEWLSKYTQSARIGVDPKLMTYKQATSIEDILRDVESQLIYTEHNLIDQIWYERPALPLRPLFVLGMEFTGKHASEKLKDVDNWLGPKRAFIASALDDIAWVLNLRYVHLILRTLAYCETGVRIAYHLILFSTHICLFHSQRRCFSYTKINSLVSFPTI